MSMSKLERERAILYYVRICSNLSRPPGNEHTEVLLYCENRVAELEAAEKEGQILAATRKRFDLRNQRMANLEQALETANAKIERLEGRFDQHNHHHEMIADEAKCVTFALSGPKQIEEVKP